MPIDLQDDREYRTNYQGNTDSRRFLITESIGNKMQTFAYL